MNAMSAIITAKSQQQDCTLLTSVSKQVQMYYDQELMDAAACDQQPKCVLKVVTFIYRHLQGNPDQQRLQCEVAY